jgi:hypothetical protein
MQDDPPLGTAQRSFHLTGGALAYAYLPASKTSS